jgi:hypothetical protein
VLLGRINSFDDLYRLDSQLYKSLVNLKQIYYEQQQQQQQQNQISSSSSSSSSSAASASAMMISTNQTIDRIEELDLYFVVISFYIINFDCSYFYS